MNLIGLDHFAINVLDLERSADWYEHTFGFEILHKWNTTWMIGRDNMKIGLFLKPDAKPLPDINGQLIIQHPCLDRNGWCSGQRHDLARPLGHDHSIQRQQEMRIAQFRRDESQHGDAQKSKLIIFFMTAVPMLIQSMAMMPAMRPWLVDHSSDM